MAARVGVPDLERSIPQKLEIDLALSGEFHALGDDVSCTCDYAAVADWVRRECGVREFRLIESLADHLAAGVLAIFAAADSVGLTVRKFVLPGTESVEVEVIRSRAS